MLKKSINSAVLVLVLFCSFYAPASVYSQSWEQLTKNEQPTFFEIRKAAKRFYDSIKDGRKPGFKQFKRWEWFVRNRLDKGGYFDPSLNWQGWLEKNQRFGPANTAANANWTPLGPFTVPTGGGMGRLNCITFDPHNNDIIWVGAATGGLWKSIDGGQTWTTNTDQLPNLGVSHILIHPENSNIMYMATGDKQRGSALSLGIMKSIDGGQTWQFTGLNAGVTEKCKISKMLMHPDDPTTILAVTNKGIYKTYNSGDHWQRKIAGDFFDIEIHPANSSTWYASRAAYGVHRSNDSGENWTRLSNGLPNPGPGIGRIAIAVSRSSPGTLYAVYCQDIVSQGWIWGLYGVYCSMDGGNTWTLQADSPNLLGWEVTGTDTGGQGGFALVIDVNPADANELYVGSVNLWKSQDGGITWQIISNTDTAQIHVDHHDFAFLPGSSSTVFSCNDGGLFKSNDGGTTWSDLSSGLTIHQVYRLGLSARDPNRMLVGAQDNGTSYLNSDWGAVYGGDGMECIIDPQDDSTIYCSWQFGNLVRSNNGGVWFTQIFSDTNAAWSAPFVMDPHNPAVLYAASDRIYKSANRGDRWDSISGRLTQESLTVLEAAPSVPGCILASDGTRLFKTVNSGNSWTELNTNLFPFFITGIALHPHNHEILWATIGGYGRWNSKFTWNNIPYEIDKPKVFYSNDGGSTWRDVSGLLPNIPANCIEVDPYTLGVYVGTDLGVFYSASGQGNWVRFDNGLPNVIVTEMEIHKGAGKVVAATYGRGVWESPLASPPRVYPPLYFNGRSEINKSLVQTEYINILNWEANPLNDNKGVPVSVYRIYQFSGNSPDGTLLVELAAGTFEYWHRKLERKDYRYAITAVNEEGQESIGLYLTVRVQ